MTSKGESNPRTPLTLRPRKHSVESLSEEQILLEETRGKLSQELHEKFGADAAAYVNAYLAREQPPVNPKKPFKDFDPNQAAPSLEEAPSAPAALRTLFYLENPPITDAIYKELWKRFFRRKLEANVKLGDLVERKNSSEKHGHPSMPPELSGEMTEEDKKAHKLVRLFHEVKDAIEYVHQDDQNDYDYLRHTRGLHLHAEDQIRKEEAKKRLAEGVGETEAAP